MRSLRNCSKSAGGSKKKSLVVTVANRGTAHALIRQARLELAAGGTTVELKGEALKSLEGENVLAASKRRFELAWPEKLPRAKELKAKLDVETK